MESFDQIDLSVIAAADSPAVNGRVFVSAAKGWNLPALLESVRAQVGDTVTQWQPAAASA